MSAISVVQEQEKEVTDQWNLPWISKLKLYIYKKNLQDGILLVSARNKNDADAKIHDISDTKYLGEANNLEELINILRPYSKSRRHDVLNFLCKR